MIANNHPRVINLKARQLGSTTYFALDCLDDAMFNEHQNIHITSLSQESGEKIFNRIIKNAYNNLNPVIQAMNPIVRERTKGFQFANGSEITVDTTARSGTITHLLCTEFGKVCARYPQKAEEIITGSINAVPADAKVIIESTAEGSSGYFFDMCQKSMRLEEPIAKSQYRFNFFPWYREPTYADTDRNIKIPHSMEQYFMWLKEEHGVFLTEDQKRFYVVKFFENEDKVKQEYPSTPEEAFLASSDGFWYQRHVSRLRSDGRICPVQHQPGLMVHTGWDLGRTDPTAVWFFQILPSGQVHFIDYYENDGFGFEHYARMLQEKNYVYGYHFVPHDAEQHEKATNESYVTVARDLGIHLTVMPKTSPMLGINKVRQLLPQCFFDSNNCELGVLSIEGYKKKWNERMQCYTSDIVHDAKSHGADALRACADGIDWLRYGDVTEEEAERVRASEMRQRLARVY